MSDTKTDLAGNEHLVLSKTQFDALLNILRDSTTSFSVSTYMNDTRGVVVHTGPDADPVRFWCAE